MEIKAKDFEVLEFSDQHAVSDRKRIEAQIRSRQEKLEKIKNFISLKTYNFLLEKLQKEQQLLAEKLAIKEKHIEKENEFSAMPKVFFELKSLKPKNIRAD